MPAHEERALLHGHLGITYQPVARGTCETCHTVSRTVTPVAVVPGVYRWLCPACTPGGAR